MKERFKKYVIQRLSADAKRVLERRRPHIVAVTGSVGKTSTKDAVAAALKLSYTTRKSEKSFNSEFGVPLTVLDLKNAWSNPFLWLVNLAKGFYEANRIIGSYPEWLVLEVGADKPGDLEPIFSWVTPEIVVVTRFPDVPVHVEFYDSPEALIEEESIPAKHIKPDGLLVLNADDKKVLALQDSTKAKVVTYGTDLRSDVRASDITMLFEAGKPKGIRFRVDNAGNSVPFSIIGALGIQHVYPVLAACAVGVSQGINLLKLSEAFAEHKTPPGRMRLIEGIRGSTVIDDSYNSSPIALAEALESLRKIEGKGRKIAVLGDMRELGKYSEAEHIKGGGAAAKIVDMLFTVGPQARGFAEGAKAAGLDESKIFSFDDSRVAGEALEGMIDPEDVILVKGSQTGIRTERVVEAIMLHPEQKEALLVRQEKEWKKR
jgi:UDP-N-acetylmuramoyl-tripeptide--D-alanyl-D-alanine ligase